MSSDNGFKPKRACETCKRRKLRCFLSTMESKSCRLCEVYGRDCVFPEVSMTTPPTVNKVKKGRVRESKTTRSIPGSSVLTLRDDDNSRTLSLQSYHGWFSNNLNPFPVGPIEPDLSNPVEELETGSLPDYNSLSASELHKTLGLQCNRYLSYVGSTGPLDSLLLSFYQYDENNTAEFMNPGNSDSNTIRTIRKVQVFAKERKKKKKEDKGKESEKEGEDEEGGEIKVEEVEEGEVVVEGNGNGNGDESVVMKTEVDEIVNESTIQSEVEQNGHDMDIDTVTKIEDVLPSDIKDVTDIVKEVESTEVNLDDDLLDELIDNHKPSTSIPPSFNIPECQAFVLIEDQIDNSNSSDLPTPAGWIPLSPQTKSEVKQIQDLVGPLAPNLFNLFVNQVLPCYPIIHKTTFLDKHDRNIYELTPSMLGAVYHFALNWLPYDVELSTATNLPSQKDVKELSMKFFANEISKPTLSTVQAGLLFLQHDIYLDEKIAPESPSWPLLTQIIGASYEIGLHLDSSNWDIPAWEKSLRKRLAWGVYIQDKWTALTTGRPPLIQDENWTVLDVIPEQDFADLLTTENPDSDQRISVNVTSSVLVFSEMIKLARVLSKMLRDLFCARHWSQNYDQSYSVDQRIITDLELVKKYHLLLRGWYKSIPQRLKVIQFQDGEHSPDGNLHIAFFSAEISLFRHLLKLLARSDSDDLSRQKPYIYQACYELWNNAIDSAVNLKTQQLQTFWFSFSKFNLSSFVTFGYLLFVIIDDTEKKKKILKKTEIYRWSLVLFSKSTSFMSHPVFWIDHYSNKLKTQIEECKHSN